MKTSKSIASLVSRLLAVLELIVILFFLYFQLWSRFDDRMSTPLALSLSPERIWISGVLVLASVWRFRLLLKVLWAKTRISKSAIIWSSLIYVLFLAPDLYKLLLRNIYADLMYIHTAIFLIPLFLGILQVLFHKK